MIRGRGTVPEDGIAESVVMFLRSVFVEVDWQGTILGSQSFRHTFLIRIGYDHSFMLVGECIHDEPVHPIHINDIVFFNPDKAVANPPSDNLYL
jgi:hypothetical protein